MAASSPRTYHRHGSFGTSRQPPSMRLNLWPCMQRSPGCNGRGSATGSKRSSWTARRTAATSAAVSASSFRMSRSSAALNCASSCGVIGRISSRVIAAACRRAFHSIKPIAMAISKAAPTTMYSQGDCCSECRGARCRWLRNRTSCRSGALKVGSCLSRSMRHPRLPAGHCTGGVGAAPLRKRLTRAGAASAHGSCRPHWTPRRRNRVHARPTAFLGEF